MSCRLCHVPHISVCSSVMPSLPGFDEGKRKEDEKGEGSRYLNTLLRPLEFHSTIPVFSPRHSKVVNTGTTIV